MAKVINKSYVKVKKSETQQARTACLTVRQTTVKLRPPRKRKGKKLPKITVTLVYAKEENPPEECEALEWLLLTTIKISEASQALSCLNWYAARWSIEVWHHLGSSGCQIELRQLQTGERLKPALSV